MDVLFWTSSFGRPLLDVLLVETRLDPRLWSINKSELHFREFEYRYVVEYEFDFEWGKRLS